MQNRYDVFVSYSHTDQPWVEVLVGNLERAGKTVFFDHRVLSGGDQWVRALGDGIRQARTFVLVVSPASVNAEWVQREYEEALTRLRRDTDFRIIPVLYQTAEHEFPFQSGTQAVDFRPPRAYREAFQRLVCGMAGTPPGPNPWYDGELTEPSAPDPPDDQARDEGKGEEDDPVRLLLCYIDRDRQDADFKAAWEKTVPGQPVVCIVPGPMDAAHRHLTLRLCHDHVQDHGRPRTRLMPIELDGLGGPDGLGSGGVERAVGSLRTLLADRLRCHDDSAAFRDALNCGDRPRAFYSELHADTYTANQQALLERWLGLWAEIARAGLRVKVVLFLWLYLGGAPTQVPRPAPAQASTWGPNLLMRLVPSWLGGRPAPAPARETLPLGTLASADAGPLGAWCSSLGLKPSILRPLSMARTAHVTDWFDNRVELRRDLLAAKTRVARQKLEDLFVTSNDTDQPVERELPMKTVIHRAERLPIWRD